MCDIIVHGKGKKMGKQNLFEEALGQVKQMQDEVECAADMKNWLLVHATSYLPRKNEDGSLMIPTTAMATGFEVPRSTVHFTLNHIVRGHMYGNWNASQYVIVMPYVDAVKRNGNPQELSLFDTWFEPNPDTGMVLPKGTWIVRPGNDLPLGQLIAVHGNEVVYKSVDFTAEEENLILSKLGKRDLGKYKSFATADFSDIDIETEVAGLGEVGKKMYNATKDKRAFLRGVFENDKEAILGCFVRDMAFEVCVREMGGQVWRNVSDMNAVAQKIVNVGLGKGVFAIDFDKGHSSSLENYIEDIWQNLDVFFVRGYSQYDVDKGVFDYTDKGLFSLTSDLNAVFDYIKGNLHQGGAALVVDALVLGRSLDLMSLIKLRIAEYNTLLRESAQRRKGTLYERVVPNGFEKLSDIKPNLDITVQRWVAKFTDKFERWRGQIEKLPGYEYFMKRIQGLANELAIQRVIGDAGRGF